MLTSMISVAISSSHSWRTIVVYSDLRLVGRLSRAKIALIVCQIQQWIFSITNKDIQQACLVVLTSAPVHSVGLCLSDRLRVKFQTLRWSLLWTLYFPTWNCTEITDFRWIWLKTCSAKSESLRMTDSFSTKNFSMISTPSSSTSFLAFSIPTLSTVSTRLKWLPEVQRTRGLRPFVKVCQKTWFCWQLFSDTL